MSESVPPFRTRFLSVVCRYDFVFYIALIIEVLLLTLSLLSFAFADLNPETRTILMLDFLLLCPLVALTVSATWVCNRHS